jgi:3-oxoacyl-[acyl-carrier-protein] synthase-3
VTANLPAESLDAIVLATMTPDTVTPAAAVHVQRALGAQRAAAFDLNAACSGFVYAVTVGAAFVRSGIFRHVLIIGSECNSRLINWQDRNTCILFGDGAGAAVMSGFPGTGDSDLIDWDLGTDGTRADLITVPAGGSRQPATAATVEQNLHYMTVNGREVFKFAVNIIVEMIDRMLSRNKLTIDDISLIVPHQVNSRIISACCERLGYPLETFYLNIDRYGNTSAASVPIALDEASRAGLLNRGDLVCLLGFGAGMTWGYNLIRW